MPQFSGMFGSGPIDDKHSASRLKCFFHFHNYQRSPHGETLTSFQRIDPSSRYSTHTSLYHITTKTSPADTVVHYKVLPVLVASHRI